jgi:nitroreductase
MNARPEISETIALLTRRRSLPPQGMKGPGPDQAERDVMLTIAARVPDHGKLAPWRFILFEGKARERAGQIAATLLSEDDPSASEPRLLAERSRFARAPLVVGVVSRAAPHVKIPEWEQQLSAGAACMNLVIAANALGYVAAWLTEWCAYDRRFCAAIGLAPHERIAGFIHIGRANMASEDRQRPDLADIVSQFPA